MRGHMFFGASGWAKRLRVVVKMIGLVESETVIAERESADGEGASDAMLVNRFVESRQQEAFAELVRRHGPAVLGVCNRVLENRDDAQDAFQITFMVLATRAASLKHPDRMGNWLYGVAFRVARRAGAAARRRRNAERSI